MNEDESVIKIDYFHPRSEPDWHQKMISLLDEQNVCWLVMDLNYMVEGGGKRSKVLFVT